MYTVQVKSSCNKYIYRDVNKGKCKVYQCSCKVFSGELESSGFQWPYGLRDEAVPEHGGAGQDPGSSLFHRRQFDLSK